MVAYKTNLAKYSSGADANDPYNAYGWAVANNMVEALKQMKQPTRAALMDATRNLSMEIPLLLPGIKVQTGSGDGYPIEAMQITQFKDENFQLQGEVIQASSQ
jgi:branched-chain amino acid transport system substrate-binding protein